MHNSLVVRKGLTSRAHLGQAEASKRKHQRRLAQEAADATEAASKGITVEELHRLRFDQARPYMRGEAGRATTVKVKPLETSSINRYNEAYCPFCCATNYGVYQPGVVNCRRCSKDFQAVRIH